MILVMLGSPGVGKGTQANLLSQSLGWRHVSTGELLRQAVEDESPLGLKARKYMDEGSLVPDDLMLDLVVETIGNEAHGVVLDGFPRTLVQAEALDKLLNGGGRRVDRVVLLSANEEEVIRRMLARGRSDDTLDTVRHRLVVYRESTTPLVEYYREQGLLREVDGVGDINDIHQRVVTALA